MIPIVITLVITAVVGGHEFERHEKMTSLAECWNIAPIRMEELRLGKITQHPEFLLNLDSITDIGVGCVIGRGNPA